MKLVLDASMALAWIFSRVKREEAHCADRVLLGMKNAEVWVPSLWHTEIINALLQGERRRIVSEAQIIDYRNKLYHLPILTDDELPVNRSDEVMALAREHQLTAYDATYLELALRRGASLATFDNQLIKAIHASGGALFTGQ